MSRSGFFGLLIAVAVFSSALAHAQEGEPDYARNGAYVSARVTFAVPTSLEDPLQAFENSRNPPSQSPIVRTDARVGVDGTVGYRFHPRVAAEWQVQWINGLSGTIDDNQKIYRGYTIMTGANARGFILTGRFQPFLLLGGGYMQTSVTKDDRRLPDTSTLTSKGGYVRFGGGFDAYFTEHWAFTLGADYILAIGDDGLEEVRNVNVNVGAMYRF